jgi:plasmid stabilization system protein ParE
MNKLRYFEEAVNDLAEIQKYISEELESPAAAKKTVLHITRRIRQLARFAEAGAPLSSITDIPTDYRFLVCGSYLVFYRVQGTDVWIVRVLYGRRDYLSVLFGNFPQGESE